MAHNIHIMVLEVRSSPLLTKDKKVMIFNFLSKMIDSVLYTEKPA